MTQYLLSIYQPDGSEQPAPHVLQAIMKDVNALRQEMKAAGAWVFSGTTCSMRSAPTCSDGWIATSRRQRRTTLRCSKRERGRAQLSSTQT